MALHCDVVERARFVAAVVAVLVGLSGHAHAVIAETSESGRDWLEWSPGENSDDCGGADQFAAKVEGSLGSSPIAAARAAHLTVRARLQRPRQCPSLPNM